MSEPMTNHQIEDVLSSIRRLVSDDLRPRSRSEPSAIDKLMLTPALRIVALSDTHPGEIEIDRAPVTPDTIEVVVEPMPNDSVVTVPADDGASALRLHVAADPDGTTQPASTPDVAADHPPVASDLAFISRDTAISEGGAVADDEETSAGPKDASDDPEDGADLSLDFPALGDQSQALAMPSVEPEMTDAAVIAQTGSHVIFRSRRDPDETAGDQVRPNTPVVVEEPAVAAVKTGPLQEEGTSHPAVGSMTQGTSDAVSVLTGDPTDHGSLTLDETAIVAMVRGIIHDELQGALGERITRNVRKLVRAEIQRVLAARELS